MHHCYFLLGKNVIKPLSMLLMTLFFVACSNNTIGSQISPNVSNNNSVVNQGATIPLPKAGLQINTSSLQIQVPYGVACPMDIYSLAPDAIELADPSRLTYDVGEIQQIEQYLDLSFSKGNTRSARPYWKYWDNGSTTPSPEPPKSLKLTPGAVDGLCTETLEITNIGTSAVQLSNFNEKLIAAPREDIHHYNLIDVCSIPTTIPKNEFTCPITSNGASSDVTYDFHLANGNVGTEFQGLLQPDPYNGGQIITPILQPGDIVFVHLELSLSKEMKKNIIYSLIPEISVNIQGKVKNILLDEMKSILAFVDIGQISCYQLQRNTFVKLNNPKLFYQLGTENGPGVSCL